MELGDQAEDPTSTEACCFDCLADLRTRIAELEKPATPTTQSTPATSSVAKLNLPHVSIEPFAGKYSEYQPFIELFNAFIHNDHNLSDIQKIIYLRGGL